MVPDGYQKLAVIGISYKGEYSTSKTYKQLNAVYYKGSTYVALKDSPVGPPAHDGVNWNYVAKGLLNAMLNEIKAVDTSGLIGSAGASVSTQSLLDVIADKVATKLISKNMIINDFLSTNPETVLSGPMGKELKDMLEQQNRDFTSWISGKDILGYADTLDPGAHCINYNFDCTNKPSNVWGTAYIHVRTKAAEITITAVDYDNIMYTTVKRSASAAWTTWDRKISNSDFINIMCVVTTVANKAVKIPNGPTTGSWSVVTIDHSSTINCLETILWQGDGWYIYSTVAQEVMVKFSKIPVG